MSAVGTLGLDNVFEINIRKYELLKNILRYFSGSASPNFWDLKKSMGGNHFSKISCVFATGDCFVLIDFQKSLKSE